MPKKIDCISVGDIQTNCWLYFLEDDNNGNQFCAVIDPGDETDTILARLHELDWIPRYILLTHGHLDHLAALPGMYAAYAKNESGSVPVIGIHRLDAHYLGRDSLKVHRDSLGAAGANASYVNALWKPMPDADLLFGEGDSIGPFSILHVPGHTSGSIAFYDEKTGVLFSGDTLFRGDWGRTDLPGGNEAQIHQSLKRLLSMNGEIVVCPGHGPATTINEETGLLVRL